ncbi:ThiF family adenylyltransferase [Thermodesulforhabdus norvegica]|uniref:ThiF family protein n=1 Tax=Thermodesulforhabdus norvegica TaxID=39841 RepID=A0A1I4VEX9_9BACT|nr:ThiF family adenylyltransferase [Thermodesulforhabdus norvegica]SFM99680.1 ThiF family protein [Thermodesulforhabdus norvegica]
MSLSPHSVWSTDHLDSNDPLQQRWNIRQVPFHDRPEDIHTLDLKEVAGLPDEKVLPVPVYRLWNTFSTRKSYLTTVGYPMSNLQDLKKRELVLIDPDVIEPHNLNRMPYTVAQVGMLKVEALAELVAERRPACVLHLFPYIYQEVEGLLPPRIDWFVDCTDNLLVKERATKEKLWWYLKLGYDGFYITWDRTGELPWEDGEVRGYGTVPSFVGTPQFLAALAVIVITARLDLGTYLYSGDLREAIRRVFQQA